MEDIEVEILLATYNGEKYLREQLDSLVKQTYKHFFVTARDDGSSDGTTGILYEYQRKYPEIFRNIYENKSDIHGAGANFAALFDLASADYVMFCDQDDVWLENKTELTLDAMRKAEEQFPGEAVLVHTDLYVVDSELNITDPSFFHCMRIQPERNRIARFLTGNTVTGCTMMINGRMKEIIGHIPPEAVMHDWWAAFCASGMGHIVILNTPTIYYRQHGNNTMGVNNDSFPGIKWVMKYLFSKEKIRTLRRIRDEKFRSAGRYYEDYADRLRPDDRELCRRFLQLKDVGHITQLRNIFKDDFFDSRFLEKMWFWLLLIR